MTFYSIPKMLVEKSMLVVKTVLEFETVLSKMNAIMPTPPNFTIVTDSLVPLNTFEVMQLHPPVHIACRCIIHIRPLRILAAHERRIGKAVIEDVKVEPRVMLSPYTDQYWGSHLNPYRGRVCEP